MSQQSVDPATAGIHPPRLIPNLRDGQVKQGLSKRSEDPDGAERKSGKPRVVASCPYPSFDV
ncbi:MAG: hypothetical protein IIB44_05760 [Candidatus Marinimicrobia bacterium]|nr:hypothetical protein [Candidatus Neomarinimicrobiota bacterium]